MAVWLFTWNPAKWNWEDYDKECQESAEGYSILESWSCLSKKVRIGDEFYLMKLGKPPRGIIAHGVVTEDISEGEHWDGKKAERIINYVTGEWDTLYERDPNVRRAFLRGKQLKCEVCGFDFEKVFGKPGAGYIEVHHKKPVSEGEHITDLNNDLVMLCSNCHKMIHRDKDHMLTVEELKRIIDSNN